MVSRGRPQRESFSVGVKRRVTPINARPSDENRSSHVRDLVHACEKHKILIKLENNVLIYFFFNERRHENEVWLSLSVALAVVIRTA